jgi:hypothetical protein
MSLIEPFSAQKVIPDVVPTACAKQNIAPKIKKIVDAHQFPWHPLCIG